MTIEEAKRIVGNQSLDMIRNMVKALSLHPWLNGEEETRRLAAAKLVLRHANRKTIHTTRARKQR